MPSPCVSNANAITQCGKPLTAANDCIRQVTRRAGQRRVPVLLRPPCCRVRAEERVVLAGRPWVVRGVRVAVRAAICGAVGLDHLVGVVAVNCESRECVGAETRRDRGKRSGLDEVAARGEVWQACRGRTRCTSAGCPIRSQICQLRKPYPSCGVRLLVRMADKLCPSPIGGQGSRNESKRERCILMTRCRRGGVTIAVCSGFKLTATPTPVVLCRAPPQ